MTLPSQGVSSELFSDSGTGRWVGALEARPPELRHESRTIEDGGHIITSFTFDNADRLLRQKLESHHADFPIQRAHCVRFSGGGFKASVLIMSMESHAFSLNAIPDQSIRPPEAALTFLVIVASSTFSPSNSEQGRRSRIVKPSFS